MVWCGTGTLCLSCSIPIAIKEAMKLYPTRPLGVVLSLGFTDEESEFIHRTMETNKISPPPGFISKGLLQLRLWNHFQ